MLYPSKFISSKKLKILQEAIAFLDTYKTPVREQHLITTEPVDGTSTIDVNKTKLLNRLGELNTEREKVIESLLENEEFKEESTVKSLTFTIVLSQTDIFEHSSTDVYLNKKTGKLNYGFVKDEYDYNQQIELKIGERVVFSTKDVELKPDEFLLKEVIKQYNSQQLIH